jgi:hypothetical protein
VKNQGNVRTENLRKLGREKILDFFTLHFVVGLAPRSRDCFKTLQSIIPDSAGHFLFLIVKGLYHEFFSSEKERGGRGISEKKLL